MKHPILLSLMSLALSAALPAMAQTAAPAGSTGQCKDGSYTSATFKMGACRGHKGVQSWFGTNETKPAATKSSTSTATAKPAPASATKAASMPVAATSAAATGMCKDGTTTNAASKSGACRGHKGVKEWYASTPAKTAAPAPTATPAPMTRPAPAATTAPAPAAAPTTRAPRTMPAPGPVAAGGGNGQVWVNMKDKVYHCQGDRWYGTTKSGQYMSESAAAAAGARPSRGKTCGAH